MSNNNVRKTTNDSATHRGMNYERLVELHRKPGVGFGFSVIGGCDTHIPPMICALVRDSPALISRQVFVGDVLFKVNGIDLFNLQTKQVVDLIRSCKESIVLCLREDRLAKLKARPFLADGTLLDPPRATTNGGSSDYTSSNSATVSSSRSYEELNNAKEPVRGHRHTASQGENRNGNPLQHVSSRLINRVVGSSTHGVDGRFNYRPSNSYTPNNKQDNRPTRTYGSPSNQSHQVDGNHISHSNSFCDKDYYKPPSNASPRQADFLRESRYENNFEAGATSTSFVYNLDDLPVSPRSIGRQAPGLSANHSFSSSPTTGSPFSQSGGFTDMQALESRTKQLYVSNKARPNSSSDINAQAAGNTTMSHDNANNYSSPNVFDNSQTSGIYSEHKMLTLTPYTNSVQSLKDFKQEQFKNEDFQRSLLSSPTSNGSTRSPPASSNGSTKPEEDPVDPAEVASRLFSLKGYKESDVAPMLGKNTEFSQKVCREYLRFFSFDGLTLDGALRFFLGKFPLTGETQERERILIHFSKRYMECNSDSDMTEDAAHTLVCSLMLLNTDLHGQGVVNKMSLNDFITNLSGLCDGSDFSKELLKTLYTSIKSNKMVFASVSPPPSMGSSPKHKRKNSLPGGNPFIELKIDSKDQVIYEGLVYRKSVMDPGGRRTPAIRRSWRPFYCVLKGIVMQSYKPDSSYGAQSIGIHHALAGFAKDYKKRAFVFKLITSDWSVYYMQAKSQDEVRHWMDCINVASATLSSPPLPAPVSSSMRFQRPVMPVSRTRLTRDEQLKHHQEKVKQLEKELSIHTEYTPDPHNKHYQDWENKLDYTEFEIKRFKAYCSVLTTPRLEEVRKKVLTSLSPETSSSLDPPVIKRSSSMHSLESRATSPQHSKSRESYALDL